MGLPTINGPQRVMLCLAAIAFATAAYVTATSSYFENLLWLLCAIIAVGLLFVAFSGTPNHRGVRGQTARDDTGRAFARQPSPIKISAANSADGIKQEYQHLVARFGPLGSWKTLSRNLIRGPSATLEKFLISRDGVRYEVIFDVSSFIDKNKTLSDSLPVSPALREHAIDILLQPRDAFDLYNFFEDEAIAHNLTTLIETDSIHEVRVAMKGRRKRTGREEIVIRLSLETAAKVAVLMKILSSQSKDVAVQEWMNNIEGAISYAAKNNQQLFSRDA